MVLNLADELITELAEYLAGLPAGIKIITVSYGLQSYIHQRAFKIIDQFSVPFEWGEAEVFVQQRMSVTEVLSFMESYINANEADLGVSSESM